MNAARQRPEPRKSSLAGANPITAAPVPQFAPEPAAAAPVSAAQVPPPAAPQAAPAAEAPPTSAPEPSKPRKSSHKVSFYQDRADTDRMRGAILHTMLTEGHRNLSQFLHHAAMAEVERLEYKYNGGKPFPGIGPGDLPQGRPAE